ncbi:TetR/AcrR family transcriptional regulator [Paraburkholderia phytofirmans]|uniref:Transcriptional regulator, TetR family n=1 Tax=Paraburkholderia phytofirmans (strain DSM 17436 / LMG 22146 / PsJN) TaxID=398527 RepID=B2T8U2_PARPJ|nr:TetR/AcrR family transcriptional regulator [Paraburkholderia phytofirmans]ACD20755.1 transcriptional regulator, TetR family [Paraburkholderia phytofirmans PsJN]
MKTEASSDETTNPSPRKLRVRTVKTNTRDGALVQERRDVLIRAAIKVFIEKGFHEATVRDIGRVADMTQGTIYNYVKSKDDILYLVCDRIIAEYQLKVKQALDETADARTQVSAALRTVARIMYEHQDEIMLIYQNSHLLDNRSRKVILARVEEFIAMFENILAKASEQTRIDFGNLHIAANIVTFLPTMIALRRWSLRDRAKPEEVIETLSTFMARGLGFN